MDDAAKETHAYEIVRRIDEQPVAREKKMLKPEDIATRDQLSEYLKELLKSAPSMTRHDAMIDPSSNRLSTPSTGSRLSPCEAARLHLNQSGRSKRGIPCT